MKGYLVLESGEVYSGLWHGGQDRAGEVVFNTSHSGYEEIATDPSYFSQIVVMTAPMQGNYGIQDDVWESRKLWIEGFLCLEIQDTARDQAWKKRLTDNGIPLLTELDTRNLVLRLRQGGTPWGALVNAASEDEAKKKAQGLIDQKKQMDKDWVYLTSRSEVEVRRGDNMVGPKVAVLDFGSKENILRELTQRCSEVKVFNSRSTIKDILDYNPDGIMLTNGPGDPADVKVAAGTVRELLGVKPIFGICMGHQILALALGAKTYKLKFGHRGSNHPIRDTLLNQIYMTSQNHGYAVEASSLPSDVKVTHVNLNDGTVAGFYSEKLKCLGIQYHPESCPGPHEASGLFSYFVERMI
ncbi:glutamine-hydrolyzing carbamoyl-phosphate synthase small subunit [Bdellovibrio reynosensis]|uniref:Carbamoyl phosphate synthase small chain n=1 Tax=Bdellovibrio reynosensis TaxID=2835041 RepID=A0ABY4CGD6_9BACT|nr:glutamine-hydrolyzing carbamoyl-phosphate synthase small subunit [Bdellovibrio reynosensis]UOF02942.1 glutamine-hydrolyzing carbamoyl-phosphate synthase small subunit [Bdellovibrio reynosensis]